MLTIKELKEKDLIIYEVIAGSHAYGTNLPTSDTDIRGIYIQPLDDILGMGYVEQVNDEKNDIVYYEIRRFLELLKTANPNIMELLYAPLDTINIMKPEVGYIILRSHEFLTKKCKSTFGGYAATQIQKAKGLKKKINWDKEKIERKTVLDFCYVLHDGGSKKLSQWISWFNGGQKEKRTQADFGLVNVDHAHDVYAMYDLFFYDGHKGIVSNPDKANEVQLTSIPKGMDPVAYLSFNKSGYSTHCKQYREYRDWVKKRNPDRYNTNMQHGKMYDSKNMMHCYRLLKTAIDIATLGEIKVRRPADEIEKLLKIRRGEYDFNDLIKETEELKNYMERAFDSSDLLDDVDPKIIDEILINIRKEFYNL